MENVTILPDTDDTGGWLGLFGRGSHPLYVTATYARPHFLVPIVSYLSISDLFYTKFQNRGIIYL